MTKTETVAEVEVVTPSVYWEAVEMVWATLKTPDAEMLKIPPPFPDTIAHVPVDWPVSVPTNAPLVALLKGR